MNDLIANSSPDIAAALLIGLMGGAHCVGMCGGIAAALGISSAEGGHSRLLSYNLGRILSYALIGVIFGSIAALAADRIPAFTQWIRLLAGIMLIAMGFYIANWWLGLSRLEQLGQAVWRPLQKLGAALLPVRSNSQALLIGMLWGWLPCGLVYSALIWATSTAGGDAADTGILMFAFGLGTTPSMLLSAAFAQQLKRWLQRAGLRAVLGLILIAWGLWTIAMPLLHGGEHQHQHAIDQAPGHHQAASEHQPMPNPTVEKGAIETEVKASTDAAAEEGQHAHGDTPHSHH